MCNENTLTECEKGQWHQRLWEYVKSIFSKKTEDSKLNQEPVTEAIS